MSTVHSAHATAARAINAFMTWCGEEDVADVSWFRKIKLPAVAETAQATATEDDYRRALWPRLLAPRQGAHSHVLVERHARAEVAADDRRAPRP